MMFNKSKNRTRRKAAFEMAHSFEKLEPRNLLAAVFSNFSVTDGSLDDTTSTTFESSSLSLNYDLDVTDTSLTNVQIFASEGSNTIKIGEYSDLDVADGLISLDGFTSLVGTQQIFAIASTADGNTATSSSVAIDVLPTSFFSGDYKANTLDYTGGPGSAFVYLGRGGTDTLNLSINQSSVDGFNGQALSAYDSDAFVTSQAFFEGSVYDYMTLDNGSELYLQGIERLEFSDGAVVEITARPNDSSYLNQWEHAIGDVPDAWKFTRGSDEVLIISLDTGAQTINGVPVVSNDLDLARHEFELTNPNKSFNDGNHGHASVSIMSATADNGLGIAGVNQDSGIVVADVYNGIANFSINDAIQVALDKIATTSVERVVFQGGIQGEYWLNPDSLDQTLLADNIETLLFAVAAGNGGQDISSTSNSVFSGGVARLEGTFENVMAIGALEATQQYTHGLANATGVNLASYSNFGENLTFAVSTNTPYIRSDDTIGTFGGTSNANPVMAGFSSLVWSANSDLTAGEVRSILAETVMDIGVPGRDTTYGWGTPDAGTAVRRAWALSQNPELANLSTNAFAGGSGSGLLSVMDTDSSTNTVAEDASTGASFGITALAEDPDVTDTVSYQLLDDAGGLFGIDSSTGVVTVAGALDFETMTSHTIAVQAESTDGSSALANFSVSVINVDDAMLIGREIFYRGSSFDDGAVGAVAADKTALLPGQTATFANYTSYTLGINGFVVDLQDLNVEPTLATVGDFFEFSIGNDDNPSGWATAPAPTGLTYQANVDVSGTDRVYLEWDDNAIQNTWLEIRALANASTGLAAEDAFYIGNAIGETGDDPSNAIVNLVDVGQTRGNQTGFGTADILNVFDFNRDERVNLVDVGLVRVNQSGFSSLNLITPAANRGGSSDSSNGKSDSGFTTFDPGEGRVQFDSTSSFDSRSFEPAVKSDDLSLAASLDSGFASIDNTLGSASELGNSVDFASETDLANAIDSDQLKQLDSAFAIGI